jgi:UDP-N-acetylmuramyl pentapeptide phosphotransferase/UDP-N-acetylglucosamine-1-phosphate transferase
MAGGVLFILASISGTVFFHSFSGNPGSLIVIAPFLIIGILFIIHSFFYVSSRAGKSEQVSL